MYAAEIAEREPGRLALVMGESGRALTFREFEDAANRMAQFLRAQGLRRGDRIAFFMENSLELVEVQGGAERTGLYYTLVNAQYTAAEAAYIINDCGARVVVTTARLTAAATKLPALCPAVERWLMVDPPEPIEPFEPYAETLAGYPATHVEDESLGTTLSYSSGTTGRPKGVLRPLQNVHPVETTAMLAIAPRVYRMREGMVFLQPAPLTHSGPQSTISCSLRMGGTAIVMERFDAEGFLQLVERHRVTCSVVVPTMLARLLQLPDAIRGSYDVSSLEGIVHGAAPCPPSVKRKMIEWLGPIVFEYYGTTEGNGACTCSSEEWLAHPGTVGKAFFGEPLILDGDGNELPAGDIGRIWFRGATNFEYLHDDAKTAESRRDGGSTSTTGDIGFLDAEGYLFLTDRASFTIVAGGVNIYPQEIENVLMDHPAVKDVGVIGLPNDDFGEEVMAAVELLPPAQASDELAADLLTFCRQQLARFKVPRRIDFVGDLPRTPAGKLLKNELRSSLLNSSSCQSQIEQEKVS